MKMVVSGYGRELFFKLKVEHGSEPICRTYGAINILQYLLLLTCRASGAEKKLRTASVSQ
jgi:hypothetical protein